MKTFDNSCHVQSLRGVAYDNANNKFGSSLPKAVNSALRSSWSSLSRLVSFPSRAINRFGRDFLCQRSFANLASLLNLRQPCVMPFVHRQGFNVCHIINHRTHGMAGGTLDRLKPCENHNPSRKGRRQPESAGKALAGVTSRCKGRAVRLSHAIAVRPQPVKWGASWLTKKSWQVGLLNPLRLSLWSLLNKRKNLVMRTNSNTANGRNKFLIQLGVVAAC
jgi:hypothetical protein